MENKREVPVDVEMLEIALTNGGGENQWYLDLETGDVLPVFDDPELEEKVESESERYLLVESTTEARDDFGAMENFVAGLADGEAKRDLERVLRRAKPFRNFREALREWPEVRQQWHAVQEKRSKDAVQVWLEENGIEAAPRAEGA